MPPMSNKVTMKKSIEFYIMEASVDCLMCAFSWIEEKEAILLRVEG